MRHVLHQDQLDVTVLGTNGMVRTALDPRLPRPSREGGRGLGRLRALGRGGRSLRFGPGSFGRGRFGHGISYLALRTGPEGFDTESVVNSNIMRVHSFIPPRTAGDQVVHLCASATTAGRNGWEAASFRRAARPMPWFPARSRADRPTAIRRGCPPPRRRRRPLRHHGRRAPKRAGQMRPARCWQPAVRCSLGFRDSGRRRAVRRSHGQVAAKRRNRLQALGPLVLSPRRESRNWTRSAVTRILDRFSPVFLSSQLSIRREPST